MRFENWHQHCPEQFGVIRALAAKEKPDVKQLSFLLSEASLQGLDAFPDYKARLQRYRRKDIDRFIAEREATWQAVRAIPGFDRLRLDRRLGETLYRIDYPYFEAGLEHPEKLLIVFTTMYNNFYLSNLALIALLRPLGVSILLLKDASRFNYLNGIPGLGADIPASVTVLNRLIARRGIEQVYISGFSSSGYVALLASLLLPCQGYLGFSIRSDLSAGSALDPGFFFTDDIRQLVPAEFCTNLAPRIDQTEPVVARRIIYGSDSDIDRDHARNIAGRRGVTLHKLEGCGHSTVGRIFLDGDLLEEFRRLAFEAHDKSGQFG